MIKHHEMMSFNHALHDLEDSLAPSVRTDPSKSAYEVRGPVSLATDGGLAG